MIIDASILWVIAGVLLLIGEMLSAGFFLLFVALGCFTGALFAFLGFSYLAQGFSFALVTAGGIFLLRKPIQRKLLRSSDINPDIGKEFFTDQPIAPHGQTRISYQGTTWLANNLDSNQITTGDRIVIVGVDGNILLVRKSH